MGDYLLNGTKYLKMKTDKKMFTNFKNGFKLKALSSKLKYLGC